MLDAAIYCHQVWCCSRVQPMAFLCQNARSWLLCCNDTSADLLLQGLDVDTVLQDGKYYFWTSLCVLQRVCITQGRGSLHPGALWVELPQWVFWSGFISPGNCRWSILWSQATPVAVPFDPWWSIRKNPTGIPHASLDLAMPVWNSPVWDLQDIFFLQG